MNGAWIKATLTRRTGWLLAASVLLLLGGCRPGAISDTQTALDRIERITPDIEKRNSQIQQLSKPKPGLTNEDDAPSQEP